MRPHAHFPALPVEGNPDSAIRVDAWEDLACPDTTLWQLMLIEELLPAFGDRVAFVAHDFPLEKHHWAEAAAMASRRFSAWDSAAGLRFRRYCLTHIAEISVENLPERIVDFAVEHGFDAETAELSLRDEALREAVAADRQSGHARGVHKTPTVFVGAIEFVETFSAHAVATAIEAALTAAP